MSVAELKKKFIDIYGGSEEDLRVFASPGRVNLIGEHTDYNGGYVFPAALTVRTTIVARKRNDKLIRLAVTDLPDRPVIDITKIDQYKNLRWGNYQAGVIDEFMKAGYEIVGCDLLYDDTVPHGSGLSSSAANEVSTAIMLATFSNEARGINEPLDLVEIAKICQRAENNYVGVKCGIMDQFTSAMGKKDHAMLLNCKTLEYRFVPLDLKGHHIVIANTNKKHRLGESKYNGRRSECEKGFEILKKYIPNATCLCDITKDQFEQYAHHIEDEVIRNRVKHVIYENARVLRSVDALSNGDLIEFGKLMNASHDSLRDLYEVTGVELDTLVEEARKIDGVVGSRMTGAGFGGCTVNIVREDAIGDFIREVGLAYEKKIGYPASFYISEIGSGGGEIFE
ncbi:MAG: galactokinase [Clostridiaceae bacterium]|nr:galactokinase [Clostridiaceae bacterium]